MNEQLENRLKNIEKRLTNVEKNPKPSDVAELEGSGDAPQEGDEKKG